MLVVVKLWPIDEEGTLTVQVLKSAIFPNAALSAALRSESKTNYRVFRIVFSFHFVTFQNAKVILRERLPIKK